MTTATTEKSPIVKNLITLVSGVTSGVLSKVVEYPFDTVKVKLQTQGANNLPKMYNSTSDCFKKIYQIEGFRGFFRGVTAPVVGACLELGVTFWGYEFAIDLLGAFYRMRGIDRDLRKSGIKMKHGEVAFAGAIGGWFSAFLLTPVELGKCKMQVQANIKESLHFGLLKEEQGVLYRGLTHFFVATVKQEGIFSLYRGYIPTLAREMPGNMMWFYSYEMVKRFLSDKMTSNLGISLLAGCCSGLGFWTLGMPADRIKSIMQTETVRKHSLIPTIVHIAHVEGFKGFYRGYLPTVARSMPSNAAIFTCYELSTKFLNSIL